MRRAQPIAVRFLVLTFAPVVAALIGGFWLFGQRIEDNVRQGLSHTLNDAQRAQTRLRLQARRQQELLVAALAESATLKAGLTLWLESGEHAAARRTIEDQLAETGAVQR